MQFSVGDLVTLASVVLAAGVTLERIGNLRGRVKRLEEGAEKRGERFEKLDRRLTVLEYEGRRRGTLLPPGGVDE